MGKFLPAEYKSLVPPSRVFSSKKELYFALCNDPLLIDHGKKSIWLEKASGKRCIMLSAMNLSIIWVLKSAKVMRRNTLVNSSSIGIIIVNWLCDGVKREKINKMLKKLKRINLSCCPNLLSLSSSYEYESLISQSRVFSSKKELYFALCDESVLIDDGKKSLWIEKSSAKRCIMLSAMNLAIAWENSPRSWRWIPDPGARFETAAELLEVRLFEIRGRANSCVLSPRTRYSAYIVFMKENICYGFENVAVEVVVGVVGQDLEEHCRRYVCFDEARAEQFRRRDRGKNLVKPVTRKDGWMEIKVGEFFNEGGLLNYDEIEMIALETKQCHWKRGLII